MQIAEILIERKALALDRTFSYLDKDDAIKSIGVRVIVTFNNAKVVGYVTNLKKTNLSEEEINKNSNFIMKNIDEVIDVKPLLSEELLALAYEIKDYYVSPLISVLQAMLPPSLKPKKSALKKPKIHYVTYVHVIDKSEDSLSAKQKEIYRLIAREKEIKMRDLMNHLSIVNTLIKLGKIEKFSKEELRLAKDEIFSVQDKPHLLNEEQKLVVDEFLNSKDMTYLLYGVTGSGKTEVYLHLAKYYLDHGKSVLFLVPEISLTPLMVSYFKKRFAKNVAILHSDLSEAEKYDEYRHIASGEARIVVGARSAIFAPLKNLGLIILDEEHVESYKQDSLPFYHARDVAIMRARRNGAKVLLGSATPSLESFARAYRKVYHLLVLKHRINHINLPKTTIVDSSDPYVYDHKSVILSKVLRNKISQTLARREQVILLLNRRGFASRIECRRCGHVFVCPNCHIPLVYHTLDQMLKCHHCGYVEEKIDYCPDCGYDHLSVLGFGTERLEEEVKKLFPNVKTLRLDKDVATKRGNVSKILKDFFEEKADILIGTQMVAKGHDFAKVTLVGVINADIGLAFSSYRSAESCFELVMQAIGRAGRSKLPGEAVIQTYNPNHYAISCGAKQDYDKFYVQEMKVRKVMNNPPFYFQSALYIEMETKDDLYSVAMKLKEMLEEELDAKAIVTFDESEEPLFINGRFRVSLIIKYKDFSKVKPTLVEFLEKLKNRRKVVAFLDVDAL